MTNGGSKLMEALVEIAPTFAIIIAALGILGYVVALALAVYLPASETTSKNSIGNKLRTWFEAAPAQNLGLPSAAIAAFVIVTVLLRAYPSAPDASGSLAFKAFGLEFSGPSGPVTLWLLCFMGFVLALKLLR